MKNAMLKNAFAEMKKTRSRFLSIFGIIAIGTGFFAGLISSEPDMKLSSDGYFDRTNLMNYRIISTYGFDDNDIEALKQIDGLEIYPGYFTDAFVHTDNGDKVARLYSLDNIGENNKVNQLQLSEGRFPENAGECIIDDGKLVAGYNIGDKISLKGGSGVEIEDSLSSTEFTIVGKYYNPMFISDTERGNTTIGNGSVYMTAYIPAEVFSAEYYTQVFVTADSLMGYNCYSDEYEQLSDEIMDRLEKAAENRETERFDGIIADAEKEIADAEKELNEKNADAQKEIDDAKAELADAKKELDDAEAELDDAKSEIEENKDKLEKAKTELTDSEKLLSDTAKTLAENKIKLDDAKKQLDNAKKQLSDSERQLNDSKQQLDSTADMLEQSSLQLEAAKQEITAAKQQIEAARQSVKTEAAGAVLAIIQSVYPDRFGDFCAAVINHASGISDGSEADIAALNTLQELIKADNAQSLIIALNGLIADEDKAGKLAYFFTATEQRAGLIAVTLTELAQNGIIPPEIAKTAAEGILKLYYTSIELDKSEIELDKSEGEYNAGYKQYSEGKAAYEAGLAQYNEGKAAYDKGLEEYNKNYADYESGLAAYNDGVKQYNDGKAEYEKGLQQYNDGVQQLKDGEQKYLDGVAEYEDGVKKYNDGLAELADAEKELSEKTADAKAEIADARKELSELKKPVWYVYDREGNPGYAEYGQNAERIKNIALVFPIFFVLVAALVCLTTMTRMVEEQRTQIGTLKALGYNNGSIIFKYLLYAVIASVAGALFGTLIGLKLFPAIIISAYGMMYKIPDMILPYNIPMMGLTIAAAAVLVIITVYAACKAILKEQPAELMRPKAPKSGKKILLERVGFIWRHMSFSLKVTFRNLFRYKRRMFMTIVGIAGCTALVLTGFGVYDSVNDILMKQFYDISTYTAIAAHNDDISDSAKQEMADTLKEYGCTSGEIYQKQITAVSDDGRSHAYIFGAADSETIEMFVNLKSRTVKNEQYHVSDDGVIINEKLATLLGGVKVGEDITLEFSDTDKKQVKISAICENYANHYVYITEPLYKELYGEGFAYNSTYFNEDKSEPLSEQQKDDLAKRLMEIDGVMGISYKTAVEGTFSDMLKSLNMVVVVLIVSAGLLAFIVLYNLTNININERIREIATLKVLGFYDPEVSMYVFRETLLLTVLGTAAGLLLGRVLVDFVIKTAEIDQVMFGREVHPLSFILSVIITMVFAFIVTLFMHKRLKNVDMVEALKSVE